nr:zf-CCHC domain-containing protein [Tanacetum cinerariifolium]
MSTRPSYPASSTRKLVKAHGSKRMPEFNMDHVKGSGSQYFHRGALNRGADTCHGHKGQAARSHSQEGSGSGGGADDHECGDEDLNGDVDEGSFDDFMAFYKFTIDDDLNMEQVDQNDNSQEHSLFRTRYAIHQKIFDVVIDDDSPENFVSRDVVQHLKCHTPPRRKHEA